MGFGMLRRTVLATVAIAWTVTVFHFAAFHGLSAPLILDDFAYTNTAVARQAWVAQSAPPVAMSTTGDWGTETVMTLPCDFAVRNVRCYWDRAVSLNLAAFTDFALEVYAPDPGAISYFTLYFRSGAGWYSASASISQPGWQTLRFSKGDFVSEGTPAGWPQISSIRLSPWKGAARNTYLAARELRAFTPPVLLLRDDQSSNPNIIQETIDRHLDWFERYQIQCGVVSRAEVESGLLAQGRLAILPYNENISPTEWTALENFVAGGGKLLVYYLLPARMEPLLGVRRTGWAQGDFAAWRFADPSNPALPVRVQQASWNITYAVPNGSLNSRVSAIWENSQGTSTGRAAWLSSDNGYFMSHVLLGDDADQKSYALLCLVGQFLPEVWPAAATGAIEGIGRVGPYHSYTEAVAGIRRDATASLRAPFVEDELAAAATERDRAVTAIGVTNYAQTIVAAHAAQSRLKQAYFLSLKPVTPEFRAIWEHHATGPYPGNWAAAMDVLATNGFTAVFPNMLWGGLAHYDSAVLPHSAEFATYGDQIAACVNAAHAHGLQVHVWKVNYNLSGAPQSFVDGLRAANRTQVSRSGEPMDWLCPSHPDNFTLETNSLLEVVRNYDVDGIHFDYIRYPNSDHCYCSVCRDRFQTQTGQTVANWPADVLGAGALRNSFQNWRRDQITRLVSAVYAGVKALKPAVQVSAAVFPDASSAFDGEGQDWRRWIADGIVDFLCPMDYSTDLNRFTNLVAQQLSYADGRVPIYPGIGAFILEPDGFLAQLQATRAAATGGFIVFELSPTAVTSLLPAVRAGATAPDEPDTDRDLLPDSWELRWFDDLATAGLHSDSDGDGLTDFEEYVIGSDPAQPNPGLTLHARLSGDSVELSFPGQAITGAGYQNAERYYRLEGTAALAGAGPWQPVPGSASRTVAAGTETLIFSVSPVLDKTAFYRVRVWLQQKQ
jgi:uncharacterized lipoprotein YddW (UPF0748 family)